MVSITPQGKLVHDCTIAGETRADDAFPAHPGGAQLSADRFLLVFATRGWRGTDEDRSIVYQLRSGDYTGAIIKEGCLARICEDWDPDGQGTLVKLHGHPQVFGVPKDALVGGAVPVHANRFVIKWRRSAAARTLNSRGAPAISHGDSPLQIKRMQRLLGIEWAQFRLNDAENDIEPLTEPALLRQRGCTAGESLCDHGSLWMNHGMAQPVPCNDDATEWLEACAFDAANSQEPTAHHIATVRFTFNPRTGLYEWTDVGPPIAGDGASLSEPSVLPYGSDWLIVARNARRKGDKSVISPMWMRTSDPLHDAPVPQANHHVAYGPIAAYACADGRVRMLCNAPDLSPGHTGRNPLFCLDVDPDRGFAYSQTRTVLSTIAAGLPLRPEAPPIVDMAKLLPHAGGDTQHIVHRVRTGATYEGKTGVFVTDAEKEVHGIYHAVLRYQQPQPASWCFARRR